MEGLRDEVRTLLKNLQALDGFADQRRALPVVPEFAAGWPWRGVLAALEDRDAGIFVWEWRLADEVPRDLALLASSVEGHRRHSHDGRLELRVPLSPDLPDEPVRLDALYAYRQAVERFADRFVVGAQWSARAVHLALQTDEEIRLPQTWPEGMVRPPVDRRLVLDPDADVPRSRLRQLGQALIDAATAPSDESSLTDGVPELSTRGRGQAWNGAVEAVRLRLSGKAGGHRSALLRAREFMDAAVNGRLGAPPLEPSDDPAFPKRERERRRHGRTFGDDEAEQLRSD
jgi:hypothetical protein